MSLHQLGAKFLYNTLLGIAYGFESGKDPLIKYLHFNCRKYTCTICHTFLCKYCSEFWSKVSL